MDTATPKCQQCDDTTPPLGFCPVSRLWFCNAFCRETMRDTKPELFVATTNRSQSDSDSSNSSSNESL